MKITGKYEIDENFTTVYSNNTIYTIANATDSYSKVSVGQKTALGQILTQEAYYKMASECEEEGSFEI
jgi:hypothetical protein